MRTLVALLTTLSVLASGIVPWHRCAPADGEGGGVLLVAGTHAHDGHEECGHGGPAPEPWPDHERCCVDTPQDPAGLPTATVADLDLPRNDGGWLETELSQVSAAGPVSWDAPVPRLPTTTVVLLR